MAKREWFPRQRDALQRHRNLITYLLVVLGLLGAPGFALLCLLHWALGKT